MKYDEALEAWGALKLAEIYPDGNGFTHVQVAMNFSEGFSCCGGRDPECYCSLAESPRADVTIQGFSNKGNTYRVRTVDASDFDFLTVLREICEAAGGSVETL